MPNGRTRRPEEEEALLAGQPERPASAAAEGVMEGGSLGIVYGNRPILGNSPTSRINNIGDVAPVAGATTGQVPGAQAVPGSPTMPGGMTPATGAYDEQMKAALSVLGQDFDISKSVLGQPKFMEQILGPAPQSSDFMFNAPLPGSERLTDAQLEKRLTGSSFSTPAGRLAVAKERRRMQLNREQELARRRIAAPEYAKAVGEYQQRQAELRRDLFRTELESFAQRQKVAGEILKSAVAGSLKVDKANIDLEKARDVQQGKIRQEQIRQAGANMNTILNSQLDPKAKSASLARERTNAINLYRADVDTVRKQQDALAKLYTERNIMLEKSPKADTGTVDAAINAAQAILTDASDNLKASRNELNVINSTAVGYGLDDQQQQIFDSAQQLVYGIDATPAQIEQQVTDQARTAAQNEDELRNAAAQQSPEQLTAGIQMLEQALQQRGLSAADRRQIEQDIEFLNAQLQQKQGVK